jgi:hypothetical protein
VKGKTKSGLAAVLILALICFALWKLWLSHKHSVAWGDVPTWLAFVVVLIGLPAALLQLNMQRIQLREQQGELRERQILLERQQADRINLTRDYSDSAPESYSTTRHVWMAVVTNDSERPIRDVASRIQLVEDGPLLSGARIGELVPMEALQAGRAFQDIPTTNKVAMIRVNRSYGFAFGVSADDNPTAQAIVRFTDDAGLHWQLDQDLHLQKLRQRNDW